MLNITLVAINKLAEHVQPGDALIPHGSLNSNIVCCAYLGYEMCWLVCAYLDCVGWCMPIWTVLGSACLSGLCWVVCAYLDCVGWCVPTGLCWVVCAYLDCVGRCMPICTVLGGGCLSGLCW